ncbi:MAG: hypothetical protein K5873_01280 [Treponema sp.]|nr:hypothetical protein [Treponema sp.]
MKRSFATAAFALLSASALFAGGIENKTNMSTGYLRNPSRNTESKRSDAAFYNIAGTAFMKDGLYIEAGNQFIVKEYKNEINDSQVAASGLDGKSYNDETFVYLYPDADIVYKHDRWAAFANFGIYAGGGKLEYSEGTSATALAFASAASQYSTAATQYAAAGNTTLATQYGAMAQALLSAAKNHSFTVNSVTYGWQLGGSYALTDYLSLALAGRLTYGTQTLELTSSAISALNGGDKVSYNASATGFTGVFGIHAKPVDGLDLAGQFAWRSKMNYEITDQKGSLFSSFIRNDEFRSDLAPSLNLGAGYQLLEELYVSTSFNYYFNNLAEMNSALSENDYNNSFEIALGADYDIMKSLTASLGFAYGHQGVTDTSNNVFNPILDSFQIGGGLEVKPVEDLTVTGGVTWVKYFPHDYYMSGIKTELSKPTLLMFSLGLTYHFPNL